MIKAHQQFDLCGKKTFEKAVIKAPFRVTYDMPDAACFYYLIEGETDLFTPLKRINLEVKEGIVMQCGTYLANMLSVGEKDYCEAIAIHLYPDILKMIYERDFPDFIKGINRLQPLTCDKVKASQLLKSYIESLQFYFDNPELVSDELLTLKLKELILLLAKTDKAEEIKQLFANLFSPISIDFREVIEANLYNNLTIEDLAKLTNLSVSSFKREFARQYDKTPAKYIRQKKLEKAAQLLRGTNLRITDIALDCGFVDLAHFSKSFQKTYQASPSEYRLN